MSQEKKPWLAGVTAGDGYDLRAERALIEKARPPAEKPTQGFYPRVRCYKVVKGGVRTRSLASKKRGGGRFSEAQEFVARWTKSR